MQPRLQTSEKQTGIRVQHEGMRMGNPMRIPSCFVLLLHAHQFDLFRTVAADPVPRLDLPQLGRL